jgi:hypothetical protein
MILDESSDDAARLRAAALGQQALDVKLDHPTLGLDLAENAFATMNLKATWSVSAWRLSRRTVPSTHPRPSTIFVEQVLGVSSTFWHGRPPPPKKRKAKAKAAVENDDGDEAPHDEAALEDDRPGGDDDADDHNETTDDDVEVPVEAECEERDGWDDDDEDDDGVQC